MATNARKSMRLLSRKVSGTIGLDVLVKLRCRRLGLPQKKVEFALLGKPEFFKAINLGSEPNNRPSDKTVVQALESAMGLDLPLDIRGRHHLELSDFRRFILHDSLPVDRIQHLNECTYCNEKLTSLRPSTVNRFDIE